MHLTLTKIAYKIGNTSAEYKITGKNYTSAMNFSFALNNDLVNFRSPQMNFLEPVMYTVTPVLSGHLLNSDKLAA